MDYFLVLYSFILFLTRYSNSAFLDTSGYYKLVVAIDDRTAQNDIHNYTENIKWGMQDLSDLLHHATKGRFSIAEVEILIPNHWDVNVDGIATTQSYINADIKISHIHDLPYVNNPNICGFPGQDIVLPYAFFDSLKNGIYGRLGRALLAEFARLRYGVWEEHGYPADDRFPYYWKPLESNFWEINACTNVPVHGIYKTIEDGSDCTPEFDPNVDQLYPPPSNCRFYPDSSQEASSSLMSYHYLPTFEDFCNSSTHIRKLPTPQNYFCKYKSVMEVIEGSPDWKYVKQDNTHGLVKFNIVQKSNGPLLYILLDSGITQAPNIVLDEISSQLKQLVKSREMRNVVATVGIFPSGDVINPLKEIVPWSHLQKGTEIFDAAFDNTFGTNGGFRNFGGALKAIVENLNKRDHKEGAVVLVIKTGIETNTGDLTPESEVVSTLLQSNIKIFAAELQTSEIQPSFALESICARSEGQHLKITSVEDLSGSLPEFINLIKTTLESSFEVDRKFVLAIKEMYPRDTVIDLNFQGIIGIEGFVIPLRGGISAAAFRTISGGVGKTRDAVYKKMDDWGSPSSSANAIFYYSDSFANYPEDRLVWDKFEYTCSVANCEVLVILLLQVRSLDGVPRDIRISVSTSAINNVVDLSTESAGSDVGSPFAIYAKLDQDNVPLTMVPGLEITALVYPQDRTNALWKIPLLDNGKAVPDISHNDGIYSNAFMPNDNGIYKIIVVAKYRIPPPARNHTVLKDDILISSSFGKLYPIDQDRMGCGSGHLGCWTKEPDTEFVASQDLSDAIEFINIRSFVPLTNRITDFSATPIDGNHDGVSKCNRNFRCNKIRFEWTSPAVIYPEGTMPGYRYEMKTKNDFDSLVLDFANAENLPLINDNPRPIGTSESFEHDFQRDLDSYFGIWTRSDLSFGATPVISVIVGVHVRDNIVTTTTTTTTTVRPSTVTTTMRTRPTTDPSNTPPDDISTTTTTPRTTPMRTTTNPTFPASSTTKKATTVAPIETTEEPSKHWFQEKEGIITLSVFGGGILLLLVGGIFAMWFIKIRR